MRYSIILVLVSAMPLLADDGKSLQGGWEATMIVRNGEKTNPAKPTNKLIYIFDDNRVEFGGVFGGTGVVKLDESKTPKLIDVTLDPRSIGDKESGKKRVLQGIYELDGDSLKIAMPEKDGEPRPVKFDQNYVVLRRRVIKGELERLNGLWELPKIRSIRGDGVTTATLRIDAMRCTMSIRIVEYVDSRLFSGQNTTLTLDGYGKSDEETYLEVSEVKGNSPTARVEYKLEEKRLTLQGKVQLDALRTIDLSGQWQKK